MSRLYLADIDGSGTTDIIYLYTDRIELFLNQSGNCFSDPITIHLPNLFSDIDRISFSDILGNGTTCLVFTKISPIPIHYYYDFVGAIKLDGKLQKSMKPYLLTRIDNNLGGETQIQYCSSTKFYLEDKKTGSPWLTKLPFPVQVVEKVISMDKITNTRFTSRFKYHDGFYDSMERAFKGFGFVENWDTEDYEELTKKDHQHPYKKESYVPPVYIKTWYHTGSQFKNSKISTQYKKQYFQGDSNAYDFPDSVFTKKVYEQEDAETIRQAYMAMSGMEIRKEVYSEDKELHPNLYQIPYTVSESNVEVKLLQERREGLFAVFMVNPHESINYNYERNPEDPQVEQSFSLIIDDFGNVLTSCNVFLPRRKSTNEKLRIYPEQLQIRCVAHKNAYVEPLNDLLFAKRKWSEQQLELFDLDLKGKKYFSFHEIGSQVKSALESIVPYGGEHTSGKLEAQQVTWSRSYFWDEKQSAPLEKGKISSRALLHHKEKAVFTTDYLNRLFDDRLTLETLKTHGGYYQYEDSSYWWNKGLVQYYFDSSTKGSFFYA